MSLKKGNPRRHSRPFSDHDKAFLTGREHQADSIPDESRAIFVATHQYVG